MELEGYFDFLAPDDIRIKGTRIGIETVLYKRPNAKALRFRPGERHSLPAHENVDPTLFHPPRPCRQGRGKLYFWMNAKQRRRSTMSVQLESLYQQIQSLSLCERMELISRVFADLKADLELQEEFAQWDRLSDEALEQFEESL